VNGPHLVLLNSPDGTAFHREARIVQVEFPDGYRRVFFGALCPGDLYLNCVLISDGIVKWEIPEMPSDREVRKHAPNSTAEWFACLVRRGSEVTPVCERCKVKPRAGRNRFCVECCMDVIDEVRSKP